MNQSQIIQDRLSMAAATPGKLEKFAILKDGVDNVEGFKDVLCAAYSPMVTYGISRSTLLKMTMGRGMGGFTDETWSMMSNLSLRVLTGTAALVAVQAELDKLDIASANLLVNILSKDLRAGFTANTVEKLCPGLLPTYPYMRCSLPEKSNMGKWTAKDWAEGIYSQEKADGSFVNCNVEPSGLVTFTSRQGSPYTEESIACLCATVRMFMTPGYQYHGELVVFQDDVILPREKGNGVLNSLLSGGRLEANQTLQYLVWDMIPLKFVKPKGATISGYGERLRMLAPLCDEIAAVSEGVVGVRLIDTRIVHTKEQAMVHYQQMLAQGKEGTILKHWDAPWRDGTSRDQVKLKLEVAVELRVKGFVEGTGKYAGMLGAFECESECGQLKVNVNGRTDAQRKHVWGNQDGHLSSIITVKANSIMAPSSEGKAHSLFLPVCVEIREDKTVADDLQSIKDQFAAAMGVA